ncbi:MAG: F0F1 ATP synthase subunit B [Planctomycetota bacterium]|nr:F0F1 ATP synthase subunit B [Planctomycetota bacterium]
MNNRLRHLAAGFITAAAMPLVALAAEPHAGDVLSEEAHGAATANPMSFELVPFVSALLAFGVVFFILQWKVWPVILKALDARDQKIRSDIEDAERSRKQAQSALQQYEKALQEARSEAARMLDEAKNEQQRLAADLRQKTETEIMSMKDAARRDIEAAKRAAITEIYSQMATTATAIASKIIQRELSPADHERLVEESIGELQSAAAN